ncbi:MAG: 3-deoxy-D-manno-octulosonic acid transferase [Saprospiraceae bacterium]|nr:3-deoxy-D-manno-octulosonic acid transferase [Saprospiraceae bacterium]
MVILRALYNAAMYLLAAVMYIAAGFSPKARHWVDGRRNWRVRLRTTAPTGAGKTLWIHAASLGEFEQGRPVIEAVRARFPDWKIVLTFFSPSGYEIRKNYPHADLVCYLPADTRRNAADFIDIVQPDVAVFVKYEFWANYLFELKKREIPVLLVSALFRKQQPFFQWYGAFWRRMLGCFTQFFVQDRNSAELLQRIGFQNITVAGDTRIDRVLHLAAQAPENELVAAFQKSPLDGEALRLLIAGSTWPPDEAILVQSMQTPATENLKYVLAPHDPSAAAITHIRTLCAHCGTVLAYSEATPDNAPQAPTLLIDNVGLLNTLYRYGHIAYIGGGFGKGIHNTLEPAAFGLPVIFGPKYERFEEARQFVARGGAFSVRNADELEAVLEKLQDKAFYENASRAVLNYLEENRGATDRIVSFMENIA